MISDETFPKKEHLIKTKDFRKAYKEGVPYRAGPIILYSVRNGSEYSRLGVVVSARNVKLANRRNRIKRLLREAYRKTKKGIKTGFDIVLVVKKDLSRGYFYKDIEKVFLRLIKEAHLQA
ncbi:MAG: ribonuclease P protein component [Candidatus Omnitrophota bacterium]|jgi:ribonuclease P protein component